MSSEHVYSTCVYLCSVTRAQIIENLRHIPCAPSVQMQEVPRDYTSSDDEDDEDDYDVRITRKLRSRENNATRSEANVPLYITQ